MEESTSNRLSKVLASAGVASRRACEELIFEGRVTVNGTVVRLPQTIVSLATDRIEVDGERISASEERVLFLLNKPVGYLCSNARRGRERLVIDLFRSVPYRLFTVGRLDKETSGLLLVTNDGAFAQEVIHPSNGVEKEYVAEIEEEISPQAIKKMREGVEIEGRMIFPLDVRKADSHRLHVTVGDGKKHEVRLLVAAANLTLFSLRRIRIGALTLGSLREGEWRELSQKEKATLMR